MSDTSPEETLEVGEFKVGARGVQMLLQALSRGTAGERLRTALREGFQNAIDASLSRGGDGRHTIQLDMQGEDVVLRDHGVGLTPHEISSLLLELFSTGKEEGLGGFGVGAGSVMLGAPEVVIRTRKAGSPGGVAGRGAEFRRSWAGNKAPRLLSPEEGRDFGEGTEIRFAGILTEGYESGKVSRSYVERMVSELFATSQLPETVELVVNGEPLKPLFEIGPDTRKLDSGIEEAFPGALVEHHVVPMPEKDERHPHLPIPRSILQLEDPNGSGWAITQWFEHLDEEVGFLHVVRVRPTVRPDTEGYPFNYERTTIADDTVRESIQQTRHRFVVDRSTALKQQTWKHTYYTGTEKERDASNPTKALADETKSEKNRERVTRLVQALDTLPDSEVADHLERRARQIGRHRGSSLTIEELIADQPTMVKRHMEWEKPEWLSKGFDPDSPKHVRKLAPILSAIRMLGLVVRAEAAVVEPSTYGSAHRAPHYGFLFSNTEGGMLTEEDDSPMGKQAKFLLINPTREAFRTARTPEALCDMLVSLLVHEHTHESADWHSESFTILSDAIHDRVANLRPELHRVFKDSGAWKAFRKLQGLPVRRSKKADLPQSLLPVRWEHAVALRKELESEEDWKAAGVGRAIVRFAEDDPSDREAAAAAVAELLGALEETKSLSEEALERLRPLARELGVRRSIPPAIVPGTTRAADAIEFQLDALDTMGVAYHVLETPGRLEGTRADGVSEKREKAVAFFAETAVSPVHLAVFIHQAQEARYSMSEYLPLYYAISDVEGGMAVRDAMDRARERYPAESKRQKALMESPGAELTVALAVVDRHCDEGDIVPGDALQVARALLREGTLPKRSARTDVSAQRSLL